MRSGPTAQVVAAALGPRAYDLHALGRGLGHVVRVVEPGALDEDGPVAAAGLEDDVASGHLDGLRRLHQGIDH